ncbi:hypothetical protein [Polyangium mundeleinium]|uniref:Uncharacterized protein n=1 Tax=Polyangium mundeleinium TaxID=2995306 RepID=A0ABT5EHR6_9BACT|nr:hypothetical protein [Polyangium mundeleinium]MDC0741376.1 hypothetical protein [Polyangium mundeleinium]
MRSLPFFLAALVLPSIAWAEPPAAPPPPPAPFWTGPRIAAALVMTTGASAIVAGAVYASRSDEANAATKQHCLTSDPDKCDAEGYALREKATTDGRVATTALGVGAAGVFLGLVLGWINPEAHPSPAPAKVTVVPVVSGAMQGLVVMGRF